MLDVLTAENQELRSNGDLRFSGWLFDEDKFKDEPMRLYAFMFSLGVLLITTTLTIIKDGNK